MEPFVTIVPLFVDFRIKGERVRGFSQFLLLRHFGKEWTKDVGAGAQVQEEGLGPTLERGERERVWGWHREARRLELHKNKIKNKKEKTWKR